MDIMDGTISNQENEPLCWAYSASRMWSRFIQNVTDEFASIKEGDLNCNTYYESGCISKQSLFECFERQGLPKDCKQENERVYGLLHAYLFNLLINKFGWKVWTKEYGFEHGGKFVLTVNSWILNNLNDPSLFTEEYIHRVFFYRGKDKPEDDNYYMGIFERHKKTVKELIKLLTTFHELVQKGILKMKTYCIEPGMYYELVNTGNIIDNAQELIFKSGRPSEKHLDGTYSFKNKKANQILKNVVPFSSIKERENIYETFMNYLKLALDNNFYAVMCADKHATTIVKCKEILDKSNKLIDLELYIKNSWGIRESVYLGKHHHNGMFKIGFKELVGKMAVYPQIMFAFPDIEDMLILPCLKIYFKKT